MLDNIVSDCAQAELWPLCPSMQAGAQGPAASLRRLKSQVDEHQERLFNSNLNEFKLIFWEGDSATASCRSLEVKSFDELEAHFRPQLENGEKDPMIRHIFLSAANSRRPLNCTLGAFQLLCTYHQTSPEFADMLLSFCQPTQDIVHFHQPQCHQEYFYHPWKSAFLHTEELGRSGWELRTMHKLSAMERSGEAHTMRQLAVYHCFDFSNGRSFSITAKADNAALRQEVASIQKGIVPTSVAESFVASLETHLLGFIWCVEGWKDYIGSLELEIRSISKDIHNISLSIGEENNHDFIRRRTLVEPKESSPIHGGRASRQSSFKRMGSFFVENFGKSQSEKTPGGAPAPDNKTATTTKTHAEIEEENKKTIDGSLKRIQVLRNFPFRRLQKLNEKIQALKEARLVINLNEGVLRESLKHYEELFNFPEFPPAIKRDCIVNLEDFERTMQLLAKKLIIQSTRADTLMQVATDAKSLYNSILQLQSTETNALFAMDALGTSMRMESSTKRMEDIAQNTERDTASMHVITFFALFFLPGTFLGSFFSTPIFDKVETSEAPWDFNWALFEVFLKICFPMMGIIMVLWWIYMYWAKVRRSKKQADRVAQLC